MNPPDDNLPAALARHQIELPPPQVALLERYCELLWDWNTKINLTRHTDYEKFVARDLVDSLAFAQFLRAEGEGARRGHRRRRAGRRAGHRPRRPADVALRNRWARRPACVADIVERLGLPTPVLHARAEDILAEQRFDTLVIRAVARLKKLLEWFQPHWNAFDRLLVLKGPSWVDERGEARHYGLLHDLALRKLTSYPLPGTESESVLLQICPKSRLQEYGAGSEHQDE